MPHPNPPPPTSTPASLVARWRAAAPVAAVLAAALTAALAALLLGAVGLAGPAPSGVGYVDTARLMERYEGAASARRQLEEETQAWQANVQTLQGEVAALFATLAADALQADSAEAVRAAAARKQAELARYSEAVRAKAAARERELFEPVLAELNARIAAFGKAEGVPDDLWGRSPGGTCSTAGRGADLTGRFLDHLQDER